MNDSSTPAAQLRGSRVTTNGNTRLIEQGNSRVGAVLALPADRKHSIEFNLCGSLQTRTGSDGTAFGMAWLYRWGAGC